MVLGSCRQLPVSPSVTCGTAVPVPASSLGLPYVATAPNGRDAVFPVGVGLLDIRAPSFLPYLVLDLSLLFGHLLAQAASRMLFLWDPNPSSVEGSACGAPIAALCSPGAGEGVWPLLVYPNSPSNCRNPAFGPC